MEAYLHGVSTGKVDDLVLTLGADGGISKSQVSRICADLDGGVAAFLRSLKARGLAGAVLVELTTGGRSATAATSLKNP